MGQAKCCFEDNIKLFETCIFNLSIFKDLSAFVTHVIVCCVTCVCEFVWKGGVYVSLFGKGVCM